VSAPSKPLSTAEAQETNVEPPPSALPGVGHKFFVAGQRRLLPATAACSAVLRRDSLLPRPRLPRRSRSPTSPNCKKISSRSASGAGFARAARSPCDRVGTRGPWQEILKVPETGVLALGDVVIKPDGSKSTAVSVASGSPATSGAPAVLTATSTRARVVTIALAADQESEVKIGDKVDHHLANNDNTIGRDLLGGHHRDDAVGRRRPDHHRCRVKPTGPRRDRGWDEAPVSVTITTARVANALVVPVDSLLAQPNGSYAVESQAHTVVTTWSDQVSLGLFDDAAGLVQVTGTSLVAGERVVVPNL